MARPRIKYNKIYDVLSENPELREDVNFLITHIWKEQSAELNLRTKEDIFDAMCNKRVWNAATITRTRRLVVNDFPELLPSLEKQERDRQLEILIRLNGGTLE